MSRRNDGAWSRLRLRLLPSPLLSALLFLAWLMLNESASVALGLALVLPWWSNRFRPERVRLRHGGTMLRLTGRVLADIVVSNVEVARRVLGCSCAARTPW